MPLKAVLKSGRKVKFLVEGGGFVKVAGDPKRSGKPFF